MIVNVEQSSFSGVVLNVSRLVGIKEIIGSKVFSKSRFKASGKMGICGTCGFAD